MPEQTQSALHTLDLVEFDGGKHGIIFWYKCSCGARGHKNSSYHYAMIEGLWHKDEANNV